MGVAHVGLVHRDPCECKVKGFRAVSSIERNVSNRRHLQGVRQVRPCGMGVTPRKALDIYGSPHLTILYPLRGEQGDFEDKSRVWIGDTRD